MTFTEAKDFFNGTVDLKLVDTAQKEILECKKGEEITLIYKYREINHAVIDWDNHCVVLVTDDEATYRKNHRLPYKRVPILDDPDEEDFKVQIMLENGGCKTFTYWMSLSPKVPDDLCCHVIIDNKEYYFG